MNKKIILWGIIAIIIIAGIIVILKNNQAASNSATPAAVDQTQSAPSAATVSAPSSVPLMTSTTQKFADDPYYSKAHEIFPTLGADTKKAMSAFSYTKADLGNNTYRITLTNGAEGYQGQSVVVTGDQSVYFVERSSGDDSDTEDSSVRDDYLVAVNAQGYILQ